MQAGAWDGYHYLNVTKKKRMRKSNQPVIRQLLREHHDGLTIAQITEITGGAKNSILFSLKCMPDAYIDRWVTKGTQKYMSSVWCVVVPPKNCPKPNEME